MGACYVHGAEPQHIPLSGRVLDILPSGGDITMSGLLGIVQFSIPIYMMLILILDLTWAVMDVMKRLIKQRRSSEEFWVHFGGATPQGWHIFRAMNC
jgi:hypothetical protein